MTNEFLSETNREYREFMNSESGASEKSAKVPEALTRAIFAEVRRDLEPGVARIFGKMTLIHFLSAVVTLSLCPQFGVRLVGEGMGVMQYFMALGEYGCIAACGAFFVGTSLLLAGILLRREEVRALRDHRFLQVSALVFLSLGAFVMIDADVVFSLALAWVAGSLVGGIAMLELGYWIRRRIPAAGIP